MRESKDAVRDFLKSFWVFNVKELEAMPARIELIFSTLRPKGAAYKKSTLSSSLAT